MKIAFLIDPLETLKPYKDTSLAIIEACLLEEMDVYVFTTHNISWYDNQVLLNANLIIHKDNHFIKGNLITIEANTLDVIFIRTDPPFDDNYLTTTLILDTIADDVFIMNSPSGIRNVNEKLWLTKFPEITVPTLVTKSIHEYHTFLEYHQKVVVKPTDGFGGHNIFIAEIDQNNVNVIFETLSNNGNRFIIVQKYIEEAVIGDKRILLLNGEPLGAILRVHSQGDHRNNFAAGGKPHNTEITEQDYKIIETIKPHLIKNGLYFVGIDILGPYLTEVNVTSPTCLREINQSQNTYLQTKIINFIKKKVKQRGIK